MTLLQIISAGVLGVVVATAASAQVVGTVSLDGPAPKADRYLLSDGTVDVVQPWRVSSKARIADVLVSVSKSAAGLSKSDPSAAPPVLRIIGREFHPRVIGMVRRQQLVVKNEDVNAKYTLRIEPMGTQRIDGIAFWRGFDQQKSFPPFFFEQKFAFVDSHWESMTAWVCVMPNPYFAVTDEEGEFRIAPRLPDGEYAFSAWHESGQTATTTAVVKGGKASIEFHLKSPVAVDSRGPRAPSDGSASGPAAK